jgi:uncharacterized protein
MTPQERQMLGELFERIRAVAGNPRDGEAEAFIAEAAREQPYAPYVLAQTALLQRQALDAAAQRIQELEARLAPGAAAPSFLGDLGHALLGSGPTPPHQGYEAGAEQPPPRAPAYAPPPAGPWGAPPATAPGGGFLASAMSAATGVAGGMLAASAIEHLLLGGHGGQGSLFGGEAGHIHDAGTGSGATAADVKLPEADPDHDAFVDPADYEAGGDFDDGSSGGGFDV